MHHTSQTSPYATPGDPAPDCSSAIGEMLYWSRRATCSSDLIDALSDKVAAVLAGFGPGSLA